MTLFSSVPAQDQQYRQEPYFHHGPAIQNAAPQPLQSMTRYLCGAAYVDDRFAGQVISELIEDEQRAVAPSSGFDLDPVVRHCFRARRLWLIQHGVLSAILLGGLLIDASATVIALIMVTVLAGPDWLRRHFALRGWVLFLTWCVVVAVEFFIVYWLIFGSAFSPLAGLTGSDVLGGESAPSTPLTGLLGGFLKVVVLAAAVYGALVWAAYLRLRTTVTDLAPGVPHAPPPLQSARIASRLEVVARAQRGNITLHAGEQPFLGAGQVAHAWSIVVELRPDRTPTGATQPLAADPVDPVALNRYVKQRVAALRSNSLPERQRVSGLTLRECIVASGPQWRGYPLIDPRRVPYAYASQQAVEAIIRHPQASARHFLRITIGTEGKAVVSDDNRLLLAPKDQEVMASAFVHIAIEGGLLYVEFVSTVLGALKPAFHDMDYLPTATGDLIGRAMQLATGGIAANTVGAPIKLIHGAFRALAVTWRMNKADRHSRETPVYNYGARESIREIASQRQPDTYIRLLDAEKYSRIVIHRVNDAVLDYLEAQGVDTSEYRAQAATIVSNTQIGGTYLGPVVMGQTVSLSQPASSAPTAKGA